MLSQSYAQYDYNGYGSYGYSAGYYGGYYGYPSYYASYSDKRLKKNITPVSESLKKVNELGGYNYFWKDTSNDISLQTGLIAQEVAKEFPELVKRDSEGVMMVNYVGLIPHLVECIKQLTQETTQLKSQNVLRRSNQTNLEEIGSLGSKG